MISICKHKEYKNSRATLLIAAIIGALLMSLTSCEIETSDNGKLDGFWHLERVDTLATGKSVDYTNKLVFWGVQPYRSKRLNESIHIKVSIFSVQTNRRQLIYK